MALAFFKYKGKFDNLVFYASWLGSHTRVLIDMEVYYYLFSEGVERLGFLGVV